MNTAVFVINSKVETVVTKKAQKEALVNMNARYVLYRN